MKDMAKKLHIPKAKIQKDNTKKKTASDKKQSVKMTEKEFNCLIQKYSESPPRSKL